MATCIQFTGPAYQQSQLFSCNCLADSYLAADTWPGGVWKFCWFVFYPPFLSYLSYWFSDMWVFLSLPRAKGPLGQVFWLSLVPPPMASPALIFLISLLEFIETISPIIPLSMTWSELNDLWWVLSQRAFLLESLKLLVAFLTWYIHWLWHSCVKIVGGIHVQLTIDLATSLV